MDFKDDNSEYSFDSNMIQHACSQGKDYVFDFLTYLYENSKKPFIVCVVPRAKPDKSTHFKEFIRKVQVDIDLFSVGSEVSEEDFNDDFREVDYITRALPTRTTHFPTPDGGSNPYPGITKDTCAIFEKGIRGQNILLIDDIYTHHHWNPQTREKEIVGVDEDCLQALLDC
ncbi:MAG: hypothetical protein K2I63_04300, partial [Helicobacter sp.]|nr:hypothetical protein [Helicobacter sp.]